MLGSTEDGHCHSTVATFLLFLRSCAALTEEDTEANRAELREWLPPPAELLRIAEYECCWRGHSNGSHPALLCASLHGKRLGRWEAALEVAAGMLNIELFHPVVRTEACR